ncbi:MAG: hypothetical protein RIA09_15835 [Hoeflea sp.]|jgi:hypothetical protein|uniref:hypothetical protein n=1 Tax=Hoeflea sp. TaxID=1940281 RepID=UPI0032EF1AD4
MFEFLLALTFWPALLFGVFCLALFTAAYQESIQIAILATIISGLVAWLAFDANIFTGIAEKPFTVLFYAVLYLAIGAGWSIWKWYRRISSPKAKKHLRLVKETYLRDRKPGEDPDGWTDSYMLDSAYKPGRNKDKISSWIVLWPLSVLMYFFGTFLSDVIGRIYDSLAGIYNRLTLNAAQGD